MAPKANKPKPPSFGSRILQAYLFLYNLTMFLFHAIIFISVVQEVTKNKFDYMNHFPMLVIATSLQLLDIVHALLGFTRTAVSAGIIQVFGRLFICWLAFYVEDEKPQLATQILCIAYMAIELFRYPYYCARVLNTEVGVLTWLRYNAWLICYPVGLTCEFLTMRSVFENHSLTTLYSSYVHNEYLRDATFKWALQLFTMYFFFPFMAYTLLSHMWHQRTKKNAEGRSKIKSK